SAATNATSNDPGPVPDRCQSRVARSIPSAATVGLATGSEDARFRADGCSGTRVTVGLRPAADALSLAMRSNLAAPPAKDHDSPCEAGHAIPASYGKMRIRSISGVKPSMCHGRSNWRDDHL